MTPLKKTLLFGAAGAAAITALAIGQAKAKMDAAAPTVGMAAPAYSVPDQNGRTHTLASDQGRPILIAFYPADFTGGCTLEAHSLSAAYPKLKALGVTVYGVSVQDSKSHKSFCTSEGIPYTLLADTQKTMTSAYGDLIPGANIANRVTYIVGADGKVAYVDKDVNSHLSSCGEDWVNWIKAHPSVAKASKAARTKSSLIDHEPVSPAPQTEALESPAPTLQTAALKHTAPATVGATAPAFSLSDAVTGRPRSLAALAQGKKATVLLFVSTRCPVSNAYNDRMKTLAEKYAVLGVSFVGIDSDQNEPKAEIASFTQAKGFSFPILMDPGNKISDAYSAHVTPEAYVLDSKGVLVYHGRIDNDMDTANVRTHELADALDATLAGRPVVRAQTKAFGCSIKRG